MRKTLMTMLVAAIGGTAAWASPPSVDPIGFPAKAKNTELANKKTVSAPVAWAPMAGATVRRAPTAVATTPAPAPAEPVIAEAPAEPTVVDETTPADPLALVLFDFDKSNVAATNIEELRSAARWINDHPQHYLVIEGHTDPVGTDAYNAGLATRRAENVRSELLELGANGERLVVGVYGEGQLAGANDAANRRVLVRSTEETIAQITERTFGDGLAVVWEYEPTAAAVASRE